MLLQIDKRLQQWRQLQGWERRVLLALTWRMPVIWLLLRLAGSGRVVTAVNRAHARAMNIPAGVTPMQFAERCESLARIATRYGLYRATCLPKSIALGQLLNRRGLRAWLRIGVLPLETTLQAHAWVEFNGVALGESNKGVSSYHPFALVSR